MCYLSNIEISQSFKYADSESKYIGFKRWTRIILGDIYMDTKGEFSSQFIFSASPELI